MGKLLVKAEPLAPHSEHIIVLESLTDPVVDTQSGVVVKIGQSFTPESKMRYRSISDVSEGDKILFRSKTILKNNKRHNLMECKINGELLTQVPFEDVLAVWES